MNRRNILLLLVVAALSFGGSFTCKSSSDGDHFTSNPRTPSK
jgi:hypothetical protein